MRLLTVLVLFWVWVPLNHACARDLEGKWAQRNDERSRWYRDQISPKTKSSCCSIADAVMVDEDIRYDETGIGHYWARWDKSDGWMPVPDDVVITGPNKNGAPVVWWYQESVSEGGRLVIRCYSPGPKL